MSDSRVRDGCNVQICGLDWIDVKMLLLYLR